MMEGAKNRRDAARDAATRDATREKDRPWRGDGIERPGFFLSSARAPLSGTGPDASRSFAAPMSTGGGSFSSGGPPGAGLDRPALTMVDAAYLRKRKLALDDAFLAASQDIEIERVGAE